MIDQDLQKLIEEFFKKTGFDYRDISVNLDLESGSYWCSVSSNDSRSLIGREGEVIQAMNYLVRRMVEMIYKENAPRVTIDINNYQKDRENKIKTTAHMMSERARFFKSRIELEPMNAYERRIVHEFISHQPDLASESAGDGKNRRVVIFFKQ
jgi:spoIIIJ-associated protein